MGARPASRAQAGQGQQRPPAHCGATAVEQDLGRRHRQKERGEGVGRRGGRMGRADGPGGWAGQIGQARVPAGDRPISQLGHMLLTHPERTRHTFSLEAGQTSSVAPACRGHSESRRAPLLFTRHAIAVAIHLGAGTVLEKELGLLTRGHLGAIPAAITTRILIRRRRPQAR